jgi:hypothetical protein
MTTPPAPPPVDPGRPWNKLKPEEKKAADPARAKKETRNGLIGLVVLLFVVGGCVAAVGGDDEDAVATRSVATAPATPAETPEAAKSPEAPLSPAAAFEADVKKRLGKLNRDDATRVSSATLADGVASVKIAFNDNLTENLIRVGAASDVLDVVEAAKKVEGLQTLQVIGTFPLQDQLGNAVEEEVVNLTYSADVVKAINVDSIPRENVWQVADIDSYVHPTFVFRD